MPEANRGNSIDEEESVERLPMEHGDAMVAGPGYVATRSQTKGAGAGILLGAVAGAFIGLIAGAIIGGIAIVIICVIAFAIGGATAGAVIGGFVRPKHDSPMEGGSRV
jgi:hypothetical protein